MYLGRLSVVLDLQKVQVDPKIISRFGGMYYLPSFRVLIMPGYNTVINY